MTRYLKQRTNFFLLLIFCLKKINKRLINWLIILISSISIFGLVLYFESIADDYQTLLKYFDFYLLIFVNIFLLIFLVINIVKVISDEFTNSFMLLLVVRPYSRTTVIFSKIISIFISATILILITSFFGAISIIISNFVFYNQLKLNQLMLMVKFIAYDELIIFLIINSLVFLTLWLSSQAVYLIATACASLFLIGGMPYNLITQIENNEEITFVIDQGEVHFPLKDIKSAYQFVDDINNNSLKYPYLTKMIYDYYNSFNFKEMKEINSHGLNQEETNNALIYYQNYNLFDTDIPIQKFSANITGWKGKYKGKEINTFFSDEKPKDINLNLAFKYCFKPISKLDKTNPYQNDLSNLINNTINPNNVQLQFQYFINSNNKNFSYNDLDLEKSTIAIGSLGTENLSKSELALESLAYEIYLNQNGSESDLWKQLASDGYKFNNDDVHFDANSKFITALVEKYVISSYLIFGNVESNVIGKVYTLKAIDSGKVQINDNWTSYTYFSKFYGILGKINLIEHWNQIWTWFTGPSINWFTPLTHGTIDFEKYHNYLMSYQDFPLTLDQDGKMVQGSDYLDIKWFPVYYAALSITFLGASFAIIRFRNIL